MKIKKILRFYFGADSLERAFDNLINKYVLSSMSAPCIDCASGIIDILEEKNSLANLWGYIDGVLKSFNASDLTALEEYAHLRCGLKSLSDAKRKGIRRAVIKFRRRAHRLESFADSYRTVAKYYAVICA